jgi:hypothetical protein
MKNKIYLAKSNRANPDHLMAVRGLLSRFDVEVVEFKGGTYSHKPMLGCDLLIVVPELQGNEEDQQYVDIGKGLHEQITAWQRENHHNSDLLIVNHVYSYKHSDEFDVHIGKFDEFDTCNGDDYVNYSSILFDYNEFDKDGDELTLETILENRFNGKNLTKNSSGISNSTSRYRLLLTKGN